MGSQLYSIVKIPSYRLPTAVATARREAIVMPPVGRTRRGIYKIRVQSNLKRYKVRRSSRYVGQTGDNRERPGIFFVSERDSVEWEIF